MKLILTIIILSLLLSGCFRDSNRSHKCKIEAIKECGKDNVKWSDSFGGCAFGCKNYNKYLEE